MHVKALVALSCLAAVGSAHGDHGDHHDHMEKAPHRAAPDSFNAKDAPIIDEISAAAEKATGTLKSTIESVSASAVSKPTFTPAAIKAPFLEQFIDDSRWVRSNAKKVDSEKDDQFTGTWAIEEPKVLVGMEHDTGLVLKDKAAHHAISAKFEKPIDNTDKTLVVQYEVKLQGGLECGGAYLKLLQDNAEFSQDQFSNASPWVIMFGPDKCGSTNKVHFIFRHKNPKTGEYEEKHAKVPPTARTGKKTTLYTLIVKPDQSFEIKIDGNSMKNGTLLEDFQPPVNPPKEIDDPNDSKPEDWVDDMRIADPDAVKPEDWDEDAPYEIIDEEAEKPADWLDDEPELINDPEAEKPADWDDEEDGDWQPPKVPNPKCQEVSGCGAWEKPLIKNPNYKGKWSAPWIENPAYKGVWKPASIANPDYFEDATPANFEPMGAVGFELWTMQNDILFDNIYIGHSVEDADELKRISFDLKNAAEKAQEEKSKPEKRTEHKSPMSIKFAEEPLLYVQERAKLFWTIAQRDPLEAVRFLPDVAGGILVGIITILGLLIGLIGGGAAAAPSKEQVKAKATEAKAAAEKKKDEVAEAVASGTEKAKEEVNKRTTRKSAQ